MILGVMSDTHGNRRLMHAVAGQLAGAHRAEVLFHLGDNYDDADELRMTGQNVRIVPGLWCAEYRDRRVPNVLLETFDDVLIACAHADHDLAACGTAQILMHGHTHVAMIENRGGRIWLNPGHLKSPMDRGQRPSYAVIDTTPDGLAFRIHEIDGAVRHECVFARRDLGRGAKS